MPSYQPFLIGPMKTGKFTGLEPWLAPADGFPTLMNARVHRGVLKKRKGYTKLADTGAGYPIMGMHSSYQDGHPTILVADQKRLYRYNPYAETLTDLAGANTFTGLDKDFFWFQTWRDVCYMCNHNDGIYSYDASTDTFAALSTAGDVTIGTCKMIFVYIRKQCYCVSPLWLAIDAKRCHTTCRAYDG